VCTGSSNDGAEEVRIRSTFCPKYWAFETVSGQHPIPKGGLFFSSSLSSLNQLFYFFIDKTTLIPLYEDLSLDCSLLLPLVPNIIRYFFLLFFFFIYKITTHSMRMNKYDWSIKAIKANIITEENLLAAIDLLPTGTALYAGSFDKIFRRIRNIKKNKLTFRKIWTR